MLTNLVQCHNLDIVNATSKTDGLWIRMQGQENSVLDYVIVNEKTSEMVESLQLEEERMYWAKQSRMIYSAHPFRLELGDIQLNFQKRKIVLNNSRFQCLVPRRNGFEYLITQ